MNTIPTVNIDGVEIPNFTTASSPAVIVSLNVIQRLAEMLPQSSFSEIRSEMMSKLSSVRTLEDYVEILKNEVDFHNTINLLREYTPSEATPIGYAIAH